MAGQLAMERKLTNILAADVVGYLERDEAGTHERLSTRRKELFEPEIARRHGRIFKLMGDGLLAEFGSVVDAVECAVSVPIRRAINRLKCSVRRYSRLRTGSPLQENVGDATFSFITRVRHGGGLPSSALNFGPILLNLFGRIVVRFEK
jgi:class 3 adenylate cyclase